MKSVNLFVMKTEIQYQVPEGYFEQLYKKIIDQTSGVSTRKLLSDEKS